MTNSKCLKKLRDIIDMLMLDAYFIARYEATKLECIHHNVEEACSAMRTFEKGIGDLQRTIKAKIRELEGCFLE